MTAYQGISREICNRVAADHGAKYTALPEVGRATIQGIQQ